MVIRHHRYFGMSVIQITSLVALALLNTIVLIAGALMVTANQAPFTMPQLAQRLPTSPPQPTQTPLPTATPRPTTTPIPGWEMFLGAGVELWLPQSYTGGDPTTDQEMITAQINAMGSNASRMVEAEQQLSQTPYAFFAIDTQLGNTTSPTTVLVSRESLNDHPAITLDEYLNTLVEKLPADARLLDRRLVTVEAETVGRLFVEYKFTEAGLDVFRKRAIYVLPRGNRMWVVQYLTERDEFPDRLPVFETSIQTFRAP